MIAATLSSACPSDETVAALIDGELTHNDAAAVRAHVQQCAACRAREAHFARVASTLTRLELPADDAFVASVAQRLDRKSSRPHLGRLVAPVLAAAAAVVVTVWIARPASSEPVSKFTARGAPSPAGPSAGRHLGFEAFVHPSSRAQARRPLREGDVLAPGDGLSFMLYNRSRQEARFLLFGVDAEGSVHWFYPAYLAPGTDPTSPVLAAVPEVVSLSEGVTPDHPAAGTFQVVAVFAPEELRVQRVEQLLTEGSLDALRQKYPGAEIQVIRVQMSRAVER